MKAQNGLAGSVADDAARAGSSAPEPIPAQDSVLNQPSGTGDSAGGSPLTLISDIDLLRCIGRGAYGEVWLGRTALETLRAVKIVRRVEFDDDRPYEREYAGLRKFEPISRSHEGFVDLLQVGRNDAEGYFYYVMELADDANAECRMPNAEATLTRPSDTLSHPMGEGRGEGNVAQFPTASPRTYSPRTLASDVKTRGALPLDECLRIAHTLTSALAELHRHGLVHRDIKPSNIIFVCGVPKLADIGLVATANEARSFVGTEGFIPPEGPGTPQADLYSLGIMLYVISTGKSHRDFPEPPADLASRPDRERWLELQAIIHRACQADPKQRYPNVTEMQRDLERLQCGRSIRARHVWRSRLRAFRRTGAVAVVAILGLTSLVVLRTQHRKPVLPITSEDGTAGTPNPRAAEAYRLGMTALRRGTTEGFRQALQNFTAATDADPKFVAAHARLFEIHLMSEDHGIAIVDGKADQLNQLSARLGKIDSTSAETHAAFAIVRFLNEWKWIEAEGEFKEAIKINPNCRLALTYYGYFLTRLGRASEAHTVLGRALALDPASPLITKLLGHCEFVERRYEKALPFYLRASELEPSYPSGHYWAGRCYIAMTNYSQALDEFEQHELNQGLFRADVERRYKKFREALQTGGPAGYWTARIERAKEDELWVRTPYSFAERYARLGDKTQALGWLEKAFVERDSMEHLLADEFWDNFRDQPKFKEILKKAGLSSDGR
ncbi:MAG: protein kinase [Chloroflexi bacterium]|nr:protein kinase [Chloroflexota bacterium]